MVMFNIDFKLVLNFQAAEKVHSLLHRAGLRSLATIAKS